MAKLLVTGSSGLIGSEVCAYFAGEGWEVHGVDNNMRATFFGPQGDTRWNQRRLERMLAGFKHHELDLRDREGVLALSSSFPRMPSYIRRPSPRTIWRRRCRLRTSTPMPWER